MYVILGGGDEPGDGKRQGDRCDSNACSRSEAADTVFDSPCGGVAVFSPCDRKHAGVARNQGYFCHRRTCRDGFDQDVVNEVVCIGAAIACVFQSNAGSHAGVPVEEGRFHVIYIACHMYGVDRHKGGVVGRVGHHAHNDVACGGRRVHLHPERQLQRVQGV